MKTKLPNQGTVYLIHFDKPYKHAKHYLGFCEGEVEDRLATHKNGNGARLLKVLNSVGITYNIVRIWTKKDRAFERSLKKTHNSTRLCPCCNPFLKFYEKPS